MGSGARVDGTGKLLGRLQSVSGRVERNLRDSLGDSAEDLLDRSRERAPYRDGQLRDAGYIGRQRNGYEVGFKDLPYIIVQHEGAWINFMGRYGPKRIENYTTPGTGPKYLEGPWLGNKERYKASARAATKRALRG